MDDIPVFKIYEAQDALNNSIEKKLWDECERQAKEITKWIPMAIGKTTCRVGSPHLDGVYAVGTMRYEVSTDTARKAINNMNRILRTARRTLK